MYSVSSTSHPLTPTRHQEFLPAEDDIMVEPLELCAIEERPSSYLGDEHHTIMMPPRYDCMDHTMEEEDDCSNHTTSSYSGCDEDDLLSTSALPGGGNNNDPPEKLLQVHALDSSGSQQRFLHSHSEPSTTSTTERSQAVLEPEESEVASQHFASFPCQEKCHMSPCASTETTVSYWTNSSINQDMSWGEWEDLIASQLSPWCDLLQASQEEDGELMDLVRSQFREDFPHQNDVQRATAMAFLQGLALLQQRHAIKLEELEEQKQQQLAMLQQQTTPAETASPILTNLPDEGQPKSLRFQYGTHATKRSGTLRRPWKASSGASVVTDVNDHDNHTVASVFSTMSCRELSIERYQRSRHIIRASRLQAGDPDKEQNSKVQQLLEELQLAEKRQKRLEQQLKQAGVLLAEDIPYQEAKDQVEHISKRMNEIGSSQIQHADPLIQKALQREYFSLEQDMEKYMNALMLTDEFIKEQQELEDAWEQANKADNVLALQQVRRFMPLAVRKMTRQQLLDRSVPSAMVKKFQRTNVLLLLRRDPIQSIARWHPSNLESLRISGLTLTERRALHEHLLPAVEIWSSGNDPLTERKRTWFHMMQNNFKEALAKQQQHLEQTDGQEGPGHQCNAIGRQCPVRANRTMDYSGEGLGFPEGDVYEESIASSPSEEHGRHFVDPAAQQRSEERLEKIRAHYKEHPNRIQQVSLAVGACEAMDSLMGRMDHQQEEWILQQLQSTNTNSMQRQELALTAQLLNDAKRDLSSWTLRGRIDETAIGRELDARSLVEVGLMEEVYETASDYIAELKKRLLADDNSAADQLKFLLDQLEPLLETSHANNLVVLSQGRKVPKTRHRKSRTEIMASLWKKDCSTSGPCEQRRRANEKPATRQQTKIVKGEKSTIARKSATAPRMGLLDAICARRAEG